MVAVRLTDFAAVVPRRGAQLLAPNQAQVAVNCRLTSGYIAALNEPDLVIVPGVSGIQTLFRMTDGENDFWLAWPRPIDAVKGPIAGDTTFRTYFAGDNEPRVTDLALATAGEPYPDGFYVLGVYPPQTAPTVGHTGGAGDNETRAYVYTFVTQWGEESQPSPPTTHIAPEDAASWDLSGMETAPPNTYAVTAGAWADGIATVTVASTRGLRVGEAVTISGVDPVAYNVTDTPITALTATTVGYALLADPGVYVSDGDIDRIAPHNTTAMTKRIYRTLSGTTDAEFQFVAEIAVATTTYADSIANTDLSEVLPSTDYAMPPANMTTLVSLPNGIMAGGAGNELCFCEPYKPYAWPVGYRKAVDYDIVGLGAFLTGQGLSTVVVCTTGTPYGCTGTEPATMTLEKIGQVWPCQARRGIANLGFGVAFPVPQGLAIIGTEGSNLVTRDLYTEKEWQALDPASFVAAHHAGRYVASIGGAAASRVLIIDKAERASVVTANSPVDALYGDPQTGKLYVVIEDAVYEWDADAGSRLIFDWLSRQMVFAKPINLGAARVEAEFGQTVAGADATAAARAAILALNAALIAALDIDGSVNWQSMNELSLNGSRIRPLPPVVFNNLTFELWVDGILKFSKTLTNNNAFKMPAGYKADNAAVRVAGNVTVRSIVVAETMIGLAQA